MEAAETSFSSGHVNLHATKEMKPAKAKWSKKEPPDSRRREVKVWHN